MQKLVTIQPHIIKIRCHHWLCLPGYKGYSYNKEHANNWDRLSKLFIQHPNTKVKIVEGKDTLCLKCPNNGEKGKQCDDAFLSQLDEKVKNILGVEADKIYNYSQVLNRLKELLDPEKHKQLCGSCEWRHFGLCKDTFKKVET